MLHYEIKPINLGAHLFNVVITVPTKNINTEYIEAKLPKWIPGSYKIRDFSRHIQSINAKTQNGHSIHWKKLNSDTWLFKNLNQKFSIHYEVYAYDLSVRGAYLDDRRFFFNHCCICLDITPLTNKERTIDIHSVDNWEILTTLPKKNNYYMAQNYAHQIDCPVEAAKEIKKESFEVAGIPHQMIFTGNISNEYDTQRMAHYVKKVCEKEAELFGELPLDQYLFLNYIEPNLYGGLEHCNSVAQMASPEMMIKKSTGKSPSDLTENMINFIGLCSHEYFHLWNIKRLKPKDFIPYQLESEQHTEMLWMFEGFTSYYDELFLVRAGVIDKQIFLERQAKNINRVLNTPGRKLQTLAQSSFDAWTKLYQADENAANNMISYYSKGAVFALALDLNLRYLSDGRASLDDVMRKLWKNYAKKNLGIDEKIVIQLCTNLLDDKYHQKICDLFSQGLHSTQDINITDYLEQIGVKATSNTPKISGKFARLNSGIKLKKTLDNHTQITFLDSLSDAANQGVSVNDYLLAINNQQMDLVNYQKILHGVDSSLLSLELTLSRRGRVFKKTIRLIENKSHQIHLIWQQDNKKNRSWLN